MAIDRPRKGRLSWLSPVALGVCVAASFLLAAGCSAQSSGLPAPDPRLTALFPADYDSSREAFGNTCKDLQKGLASPALVACGPSFPITSSTPGESPLTIDTAYVTSGRGSRLLIVQSGVHGSEAASGAAVQALLLRDHLDRMLSQGIDVLLIHAVDPWGFRHIRRTDEQNVNLNRNFSSDADLYRDRSSTYGRYRWLFEPGGLVGSRTWSFLRVSAGFLSAVVADGFDQDRLNKAFNTGQYEFPNGLNYGGAQSSQQVTFYSERVKPILDNAQYKKVLVLDVHTGLGENGVLSMIKGKKPPVDLMRDFAAMLNAEDDCSKTNANGIAIRADTCSGYFPTDGDVIDFIPKLAPDKPILAVTMEYGTLGLSLYKQLDSATRMILENQRHNSGDRCRSAEVCDRIERDFRELFNPPDPAWRTKVLQEADFVFTQIGAQY